MSLNVGWLCCPAVAPTESHTSRWLIPCIVTGPTCSYHTSCYRSLALGFRTLATQCGADDPVQHAACSNTLCCHTYCMPTCTHPRHPCASHPA
jgi:hypothetical protein